MSVSPENITKSVKGLGLEGGETLAVIGVISNPVPYQSRYRIARSWIEEMEKTVGMKLYLVEAVIGDRKFEVTEKGNPRHLQLRGDGRSEIWAKESLINAGVAALLPKDWKYMAWIDADVSFANVQWANACLYELQRYAVIQPWSECLALGPQGQLLSTEVRRSFAYYITNKLRQKTKPDDGLPFGHPGWAWACRRDFYDAVGGLLDFAVLGSGDHYMAWSMVGNVGHTIKEGLSDDFKKLCQEWQDKAYAATGGRVGYLKGRIIHQFHGPQRRRFYKERTDILIENGFNPSVDLQRDEKGLVSIHDRPRLSEAIARYFVARDEDSISTDV